MESKVVNVRVEKCQVYIGRGSKWGNPFKIGVDGNREECIEKYKKYLIGRKDLLECLEELRGKVLGCFCAPKKCHGNILLDLLKGGDEQ